MLVSCGRGVDSWELVGGAGRRQLRGEQKGEEEEIRKLARRDDGIECP